jgi:hypothetical protein
MLTKDLKDIYNALRPLLAKYSPPLVATFDLDSRYELWSQKEVFFAGKKRSEVFFAGLIIQRHYVGLYYMPIYSSPGMKKVLGKELVARLKGKSCFHITALDRTLTAQIRQALKAGMGMYRKNGWV